MKDVNQSAYDTIYKLVQGLGVEAYTHNPPEGTPYPYVKIGTVNVVPIATKFVWGAHVYAIVDVWGDSHNRAEVSSLGQSILTRAHALRHLDNGLRARLRPMGCSVEMLTEQTQALDLWRARVTLEIEIN